MKKVYVLSFPGDAKVKDIPALADGDELERFVTIQANLVWKMTDGIKENVQNWATLLDMIDIKSESELEDIVLATSNQGLYLATVLEARRELLEQCEQEKGIGPKRMSLLRKVTRVWTPVFERTFKTDDWTKKSAARYQFLRWVLV